MSRQPKGATQPQSGAYPGIELVSRRVTVLFTGFEPLDAAAHQARFARTVAQSGKLWGFEARTGALAGPAEHPHFDVEASGPGWHTDSRIFILDHNQLAARMRKEPLWSQILRGYRAFFATIAAGGLTGYFRWAWRFGIFFVFPFVLMALGFLLAGAVALMPWLAGLSSLHLLWSVPVGALVFLKGFLPWSRRFHTLHLFANWRLANNLARLDDDVVNARLAACEDGLRAALAEPADEYLIASHSMGSNLAAHALGALLSRDPNLLDGKRVVFATFGGAVLQCGLLRPATTLREHAGRILHAPQITWFEVQSLTDPVHFYKVPVARALGHPDAPAPTLLFFRVKRVLNREHYRRVRKDSLRVHRQYVLGADMRGPYDFGLLVAGPLPAASFVRHSQSRLPPIGPDGAITSP